MDSRYRRFIVPGRNVLVVLKKDQPTGMLTRGTVKDILTSADYHPRGIKVRLNDGQVGRVRQVLALLLVLLSFGLASAQAAEHRAVKVGVISNAGPSARSALCARFRFDRLADTMVISAELGASKPDPRIYEEAMRLLGVGAPECVFVDDKPRNVDAARRLGMVGIEFTTPADVCEQLAAVLSRA